ncbi:substrate-binding domain-containing protein [Xanthobacter sp. V3C-3]|uniref:LacI family DNA-binding transcriptional regulator n=1 Tax=Xanthobacter lutulentifluminis TaxID=3119935 RepID=UPI003727F95F
MTEKKRKAVIADIAAAAGVSTATVSRAINTPAMVRPELRARVQEALRQLGYVPDGAARALASRRSRSVGVLVPTLSTSIFARGVEALQNRLAEAGYSLLVANSQYDLDKELMEARVLLERGVDGLVLVGNERVSEARALLRQSGLPIVVTYVSDGADGLPAVGIDNFRLAYDLTRYLVDLGHRRFGVISSPFAANDRIRARRQGILTCLDHRNAMPEASALLEVPYTMESGRQALRRVVEACPPMTALVCTTDVLAIGAIAEAKDLGLRVPEDLSIAGFDDLEFASYLDPPLTTVHVPTEQIGLRAAELLLGLMQSRPVESRTELEGELAIRRSTGAPRRSGELAPRR